MAWRRIGDKPLSEPMLTRFNDAYMRHFLGGGSVSTVKLHHFSDIKTSQWSITDYYVLNTCFLIVTKYIICTTMRMETSSDKPCASVESFLLKGEIKNISMCEKHGWSEIKNGSWTYWWIVCKRYFQIWKSKNLFLNFTEVFVRGLMVRKSAHGSDNVITLINGGLA